MKLDMAVFIVLGIVALVSICLLRFFAADVYDAVIVWMTSQWYKVVFEKLQQGDRVLDVGIGTATALVRNKVALLEKHLSVIGIDYEAAYVRKAEAVLREAQLWQLPAKGTEGYREGEYYCKVFQASIYDDSLAELCYEEFRKSSSENSKTFEIPGKDWVKNKEALLRDVPEEFRFDAAYFSGSLTVMPDPPAALRAVLPLIKRDGRVYITQTFQKKYSPLMAAVKPLLKYITTIDFGQLTTEADLEKIITEADSYDVVENVPISGSLDTKFQTAKLVVLKPKSKAR